MPVVVDEVVITVEVTGGAAGEGPPGAAASQGDDRQAIVAECVERVLEILQQREER